MHTRYHCDRNSRNREVEEWAEKLFVQEPELVRLAREEGIRADLPQIAVGPTEGKLLLLFLKLIGAKKVVEIGTLSGVSAGWILNALPEDGILYSIDANPVSIETTARVLRTEIERGRLKLYEGAAAGILENIPDESFDAVFIDADKENYPVYLEWAEKVLRPGGLVLGDNTYFFGKLHCEAGEVPESETPGWKGIREFNRRLAESDRFISLIIPTGEGLTVGLKIQP